MTDKLPGEGVEESLLARIQALRAENERLRNGDGLEYSLSLTNAALRAENERLREARDAEKRRNEKLRQAFNDQSQRLQLALAENERLRTEVETLRKVIKSAPSW